MRKQMQKTNFVLRAWAVLALVLLLGSVTTALAQTQSVDNMRVTLSMKQVTLKTFLDEVSKQTGLLFDVDASQLEKAERVSIDAREQPVRAVLGQVLNLAAFTYNITDNVVKLTRKNAVERRKGVYGQITDADGQPLPGVTIRMQGFSGGYITNLDGYYEIETDQPEGKLTFNYIGYKPM